jgi:hypothetical protein
MPKYAVAGFCTNQDPTRVRVFASSLRSIYGADECDIVLFVNQVTPELQQLAAENTITFAFTRNIVSANKTFLTSILRRAIIAVFSTATRIAGNKPDVAAVLKSSADSLIESLHHPFFARWFCYRNLLDARCDYANVLLTDVKDVVFQRRFFSETADQDAPVKLYRQDVPYGVDDWDTRWYRAAFGDKELAMLEGVPSICAGTLLGGRNSLLRLCDDLTRFVMRHPFRGVDQPVLNHLVLKKLTAARIEFVENGVGEIIALTPGVARSQFAINSDDEIVSGTRDAFPVVHMWDRNPETKRQILSKWGNGDIFNSQTSPGA